MPELLKAETALKIPNHLYQTGQINLSVRDGKEIPRIYAILFSSGSFIRRHVCSKTYATQSLP